MKYCFLAKLRTAFGEKLLNLLDEGAFTATYKYAVLLGLIDLCREHSRGSLRKR